MIPLKIFFDIPNRVPLTLFFFFFSFGWLDFGVLNGTHGPFIFSPSVLWPMRAVACSAEGWQGLTQHGVCRAGPGRAVHRPESPIPTYLHFIKFPIAMLNNITKHHINKQDHLIDSTPPALPLSLSSFWAVFPSGFPSLTSYPSFPHI